MSSVRGPGKIFVKTVEGLARLQEMFTMRRAGYPYKAIADYFGVNHATIIHHCQRHGIIPEVPMLGRRQARSRTRPVLALTEKKDHKYAHLLFETVNVGKKSYEDYVKEAQARGEKVRLHTDWGCAGD